MIGIDDCTAIGYRSHLLKRAVRSSLALHSLRAPKRTSDDFPIAVSAGSISKQLEDC